MRLGALLAADPSSLHTLDGVSEEDKQHIENEKTHRWKQPLMMYYVAVISSMAAVVQGMDEAVVVSPSPSFLLQSHFGSVKESSLPDAERGANLLLQTLRARKPQQRQEHGRPPGSRCVATRPSKGGLPSAKADVVSGGQSTRRRTFAACVACPSANPRNI